MGAPTPIPTASSHPTFLPSPPTTPFVQRIRTWLRSDAAPSEREGLREVVEDSAQLARLEGLFGHEAAALARRKFLE